MDGAKFAWVNFIQRQKGGRPKRPRNVFETYRAEFDAPPQLDPVKIEVAIGLQREVDLVVYNCLRASRLLLARI